MKIGDIAATLGIRPENASKNLRRLLDLEVIEARQMSTGRKAYRLQTAFGWRGRVKAFVKARHAEMTEAIAPIADRV